MTSLPTCVDDTCLTFSDAALNPLFDVHLLQAYLFSGIGMFAFPIDMFAFGIAMFASLPRSKRCDSSAYFLVSSPASTIYHKRLKIPPLHLNFFLVFLAERLQEHPILWQLIESQKPPERTFHKLRI